MFSALVHAARTLDGLGIVRQQWHPQLAPMPNRETLIVSVDKHGAPVEVETLKGNTGLFKIKEEASAANTASCPGLLQSTQWAQPTANNDDDEPLRAYAYAVRLQVEFSNAVPELINFTRLLDVISSSAISAKAFHLALVALLPAPKKAKTKKAKDDDKYSIYLDLIPELRDPFQPRVAHAKTSALINQHLLAAGVSGEDGLDHYSGERTSTTAAFPSPSLPVLGRVKLYSLNTDAIPCLTRYGLTDAFRVSTELVQSVSDTLLYLTDRTRKGKTWCPIPSSKAKESDLLIAYPQGGDAELLDEFPGADMFGGDDSLDADFAAKCEPAIRLLQAKLPANPDLSVRLLALHKVSQGAQQASLCRDIRVQDLIDACTRWQAGAAIAPVIRLPLYDPAAKKPHWLESRAPQPLALSSTINRLWQTDPDQVYKCTYQHAFSTADAFDVFLWNTRELQLSERSCVDCNRVPLARPKAERALALLVERMGRVLGALGRSQVKTLKRGYFSIGEDARKYALKALPLIGILLSRLNHSNYMNNSITQLGRLLNLCDGLHLQYCYHVRRGQTPSQLVGHSFFHAALTRPLDALVNANIRLQPYLAWAQTVRVTGPECKLRLAKWHLGQINECVRLIDPTQLPARMSTNDKAQFICGYHFQNPKSETANDTE